jgi:hypothetical protein
MANGFALSRDAIQDDSILDQLQAATLPLPLQGKHGPDAVEPLNRASASARCRPGPSAIDGLDGDVPNVF